MHTLCVCVCSLWMLCLPWFAVHPLLPTPSPLGDRIATSSRCVEPAHTSHFAQAMSSALSASSSLRTTQVSAFRVAARRTGAKACSRSALRVRAEEGAAMPRDATNRRGFRRGSPPGARRLKRVRGALFSIRIAVRTSPAPFPEDKKRPPTFPATQRLPTDRLDRLSEPVRLVGIIPVRPARPWDGGARPYV